MDLHYAAQYADERTFRRLFARSGADVKDTVDAAGETLLHSAVQGGNKAVVAFLLRKGADVNQPDNSGRTALHWAAFRNRRGITKTLLGHGADLYAEDDRGQTALDTAEDCRHRDVVAILVEWERNPPKKRLWPF